MPTGIAIVASMLNPELPGLPMQLMAGRPILDYVLERLDGLLSETKVVVLTTPDRRDDMIAGFCEERRLLCQRNARPTSPRSLAQTVEAMAVNRLVLTTAAQPFIDTLELDRLISFHLEQNKDVCSSRHALPQGTGVDIFSRLVLKRLEARVGDAVDLMQMDAARDVLADDLRTAELPISAEKSHPDLDLTLRAPADLRRAQYIASRASTPWPDTEEVLALLARYERDPEQAWAEPDTNTPASQLPRDA